MNKPGNSSPNSLPNGLPDAEQLLARLLGQMKSVVGPDTGIVGIHTGGVWVAQRLHAALGITVPLGTLDVSFYRDDFQKIGLHRDVKTSDLPFDVEGRRLILVDDVLYTGRTIRAAMNVLFDYGRPASIQLAALVNRGGRELPIQADFLGGDIALAVSQSVELAHDASNKLSLKLHEN
jgi:pyrimidine operon attenuation protein / uracil phosphoribosyltransferase